MWRRPKSNISYHIFVAPMLFRICHSGSEPSLCRPKKQSRFQTSLEWPSLRLVKQYQAYCEESGFVALSRSTLLRILTICSASTRKSLQGLDYVSSAGAQAFEELLDVVEKIGDVGKGMDWAKDTQNRLRAGKRYLKGDYKVCIKHKARLISLTIYVSSYDNDSKSFHK